MMKRVRKRPHFFFPSTTRRGIIYMPACFIGTEVEIMTAGQYRLLMDQLKKYQRKYNAMRKVVYENPRLRPGK